MRLAELIRRPAVIAALAIGCVAGAGLGLAVAGDDDASEAAKEDAPAGAEPSGGDGADGAADDGGAAGERGSTPPVEGDTGAESTPSEAELLEGEAERAVRDYVAALVDRDGEAVCDMLAPGALDDIELPVDRGDCAASLDASIGYRDPRGYPQWQRAEVEAIRSVEVSGEGDEARVTATIVSDFADRDEPSVEDDVVYLRRPDDRWLVAAPSAILYRAVGAPDVPPQVLAPPG